METAGAVDGVTMAAVDIMVGVGGGMGDKMAMAEEVAVMTAEVTMIWGGMVGSSNISSSSSSSSSSNNTEVIAHHRHGNPLGRKY
jgi:hypothetical protein